MNESTVLIISDDVEFSRSISTRWQAETLFPAFIVVASDLCDGIDPEIFDLAIVGGLKKNAAFGVLARLAAIAKPAIFISDSSSRVPASQAHRATVITLPICDGWLDTAMQIGSRILAWAEANAKIRALEQKNAELRCQAALGRYTVDMRHNLNNALTSVLGNAELLLLDDQTLGRQACLQVETIRTMALRIHEFLQRFTSIENEMNASENVSAAQIPTNGARVTSASSLS